jgi:hypothetical protein
LFHFETAPAVDSNTLPPTVGGVSFFKLGGAVLELVNTP